MTCRTFADLLCGYLALELAAHERAALAEHARSCSPCGAYLESYRLTIRLARAAYRDSP